MWQGSVQSTQVLEKFLEWRGQGRNEPELCPSTSSLRDMVERAGDMAMGTLRPTLAHSYWDTERQTRVTRQGTLEPTAQVAIPVLHSQSPG